jgi:hypothetical protein
VNERSSWRGGELRGDEEKGSPQEGCSEEKEVVSLTIDYAGGGTPQRHSYYYSYRQAPVKMSFDYFSALHSRDLTSET